MNTIVCYEFSDKVVQVNDRAPKADLLRVIAALQEDVESEKAERQRFRCLFWRFYYRRAT